MKHCLHGVSGEIKTCVTIGCIGVWPDILTLEENVMVDVGLGCGGARWSELMSYRYRKEDRQCKQVVGTRYI